MPGATAAPGRLAVVASTVLLLGCSAVTTGDDEARPEAAAATSALPSSASPTQPATERPSLDPTSEPSAAGRAGPRRFDAARAMADVRHLAGRVGPRLATAPAYERAGRWVARRLEGLGYDVRRQSFRVPAGDSWGVPVAAGRSFNVVATPAGFDATGPHRVVGAHLDTVALAPGAEDNASGVAVMLELARLAAQEVPGRPTVFVAFGAEEPRGPGDDLHHFGSTHYVETMPASARRSLTAMASLDRVGVGRAVPVCTGPLSPGRVQRAVLRVARRVDVPAAPCENTASDHWSFEKAGYPVVRFGSTSYAAYHSAADRPDAVAPDQLGRTGRLAWAWLRGAAGTG
jgi:Peptidase family M28